MYLRKVLVVDSMEEFRLALVRALEPSFQVSSCSRGEEALNLIARDKPDVLVLDLMLEGLDGITLLRQLDTRPIVMVVSSLLSNFVHCALEELGVQYAIRKPCRVSTVAERILELADTLLPSPHPRLRCTSAASNILTELGLPNGRQGYQHLLTGLPLLVLRRDQRLTKELYDSIAERNGTSAYGVEKAIRDTIRAGWESGNRKAWQSYFPGCERCPKNKEFLFRMTDLLIERQRA